MTIASNKFLYHSAEISEEVLCVGQELPEILPDTLCKAGLTLTSVHVVHLSLSLSPTPGPLPPGRDISGSLRERVLGGRGCSRQTPTLHKRIHAPHALSLKRGISPPGGGLGIKNGMDRGTTGHGQKQ